MTEAQLRRAMGRPRVVITRAAGFGRRTVDYEFGFGDYAVRLFGPAGRLRVVRVSTLLRRERTAKGIGPGSLGRALIRAYPGLRCQRLATTVAVGTTYVTADERTCTLFTASGRRTTFLTGVRRSATLVRLGDWAGRARVLEVAAGSRADAARGGCRRSRRSAGALAGGSAGAVAERTALIRPGASIGKIRLGMTQAELLRAMGPPRAVVRRPAGFGFRSLEFQYGFADYTARLFGRRGRLRVVRAITTLSRERTRAGIGAGSRERTLVAPSGRRTIFTSTPGPEGPLVPRDEWEDRAQVVEVSVAEPA